MKKLLSLISVTLFACIMLFQHVVAAEAADPTTYCIRYDNEKNEWYYQVGSAWDDTVPPPKREVYYMFQILKDGDYIVVDSPNDCGKITIDANLGNLTILPNSSAVITCKSVKEYYQLHDSTVSINGNVEKAFVYDHAVANFNNNVNYLELAFESESEPTMVAHVTGTCAELLVHSASTGETSCHLWNFKDELNFNNGVVQTAYGKYDINPPSSKSAAVTPSTTPAATPSNTTVTPTPAAPSVTDDEYDDVPKTGESSAYVWMFALSVLCLTGSYAVRKKK